jgi:hypothetical protein
LIAAVYFSKIRRLPKVHWKIMALATSINAASVVVLMVPMFIDLAPGIGGGLGNFGSVVLIHHGLGLIGLALSLYLIWSFLAAGRDMKRCPTTRRSTHRLMQLTYIFMLLPLFLGLILRFVAL